MLCRFLAVLMMISFLNRSEAQEYLINRVGLETLLSKWDKEQSVREERIAEFLKNPQNSQLTPIENTQALYLYDVIDGKPIWLANENDEAAIAIGLDRVRDGGDLGLKLTGRGMELGLWDGGIVRTTHESIRSRVRYLDGAAGSEFSDHATGVASTLIGLGSQERARGMAYDAQVAAYDFFDDEREMVQAQLQRQLIMSNHSYGQLRGWHDNRWLGDPNISTQEDWRFGYYDAQARNWDEIAYNAPYYMIVKSAGNDRGDSGTSANFPPDGPFDCIAGASLSKNILTVGAIRKNRQAYVPRSNIEMSSFSGWGPTDDGRIKPDIVAVGVDVYTATADSDMGYRSTQGTSFSAPSAAGGLLLLQQLYRELTNQFMRASTLKALAIHTAKSAGNGEGPDYRFGWGLLDVGKASELLLDRDQSNTIIQEGEIQDRGDVTIELNPLSGSSLRATLVWTDPAGSPPPASLDPPDLMLVHDLDMRISDEGGKTFFPYILDPANPNRTATRGDNFRDNVEQIFIEELEQRRYFLTIKAKSALRTETQAYSLIIEYRSESEPITNLYWIGNENSWNANSVWSQRSGGQSTNQFPDTNVRVIIDDNSVSGNNTTITMDRDYEVKGLSMFGSKNITLDLNGYTLRCSGPLQIASPTFSIINGAIELEDGDLRNEHLLNLNGITMTDVDLVITENNRAIWSCYDAGLEIASIEVLSGNFNLIRSFVSAPDWSIGRDGAVNVVHSELTEINSFFLEAGGQYADDLKSTLSFDLQGGRIDFQGQKVNALISVHGFGSMNLRNSSFGLMRIEAAEITMSSPLRVEGLELAFESTLLLSDSLILDGNILALSPNTTLGSLSSAVFFIQHRHLYCFTGLNILGVNLAGNSVVSVDASSTIQNSTGWVQRACGQVLFADFEADLLCAKGLTTFSSRSLGPAIGLDWYVNDVLELSGMDQGFLYSFTDAGEYQVKLVIRDATGASDQWTRTLSVVESMLDSNYIIRNPTQLVSFRAGQSYQWYKNDQVIPGANERTLEYDGEKAKFFVVTSRDGCNLKSTVLDLSNAVTNIDQKQDENIGIRIAPNPVSDILTIDVPLEVTGRFQLELTDLLGRRIWFVPQVAKGQTLWQMADLNDGIYYIKMSIGDRQYSQTLVKIR